MKRMILSSLTAAALGFSIGARADNDNSETTRSEASDSASAARPDPSKAKLVRKLHRTNSMEIRAGGLAQENSANEGVQSYGKNLVDDHMKADVEVLNLASKMGLSLVEPGAPVGDSARSQDAKAKEDAEHMAKMEELKSLKGAAFDRQFLAMMAKGHAKVIDEVKTARASMADSDELAVLLDKVLPTLQKHEDSAKRLLNKTGPQARRAE